MIDTKVVMNSSAPCRGGISTHFAFYRLETIERKITPVISLDIAFQLEYGVPHFAEDATRRVTV
jgi:hypothetical protein